MDLSDLDQLDVRNLAPRPGGPPPLPVALLAVAVTLYELWLALMGAHQAGLSFASREFGVTALVELALGGGLALVLLSFWLRNRLPLREAALQAVQRQRGPEAQSASAFFVLGVWAPLYALALWVPPYLPTPGVWEGEHGLALFPLLVVTAAIFFDAVRVRRLAWEIVREVQARAETDAS